MLWFRDRFEILRFAASIAPPTGLIVEFGVASGATIRCLSEALPERTIFGFDWFRGLPEPWASYPIGHFACDPPALPGNCELVLGLFADTIAPFLETHAGDIALLHIDCDLYSSVTTVLTLLTPRIAVGTMISLDEFFIETNHEGRAFEDWLAQSGRKVRDVARTGEQLCVVIE